MTSPRLRSVCHFSLLLAGPLGLFAAQTASATVTEPDGTVIPSYTSYDYPNTWGADKFNEATLSLQNMFNTWEGAGAIDIQADASATNVTFSPLCGLTGAMILRGGSCKVDFGWYCADDPVGSEVVHPLVTVQDITDYFANLDKITTKPPAVAGINQWADLRNNDNSFVPTIQLGFMAPLAGSTPLTDVRNDPAYANGKCPSGKIGFAFKGVANTFCPQSKFSEPSRNLMSTYGSPWISALVYQSKISPGTYYIAFEDLPALPDAFFKSDLKKLQAIYPSMPTPDGWEWTGNDGDMNDIVYVVQGITCDGGGQPCTAIDPNTGAAYLGACGIGVTACSPVPGTTGACQPRVSPTPEVCDAIDNDCDGVADDTDEGPLCPAGEVCSNGQCVTGCQSGEMPCADPNNQTCVTSGPLMGFCVDNGCANVECAAGERCEKGVCLGGCTNRVCPSGSECIAGACVDLCKGVICPSSYVCERGACIPDCKCLPCTDPVKTECGADGHCADPLCIGTVCPEYQTCSAGACVDPCLGVNCGTGEACVATADGRASCPSGTTPVEAAGGSLVDVSLMGGMGNASGGTTGYSDDEGLTSPEETGCLCRAAGQLPGGRSTGWAGLLALAALIPLARRRRGACR